MHCDMFIHNGLLVYLGVYQEALFPFGPDEPETAASTQHFYVYINKLGKKSKFYSHGKSV